MSEHKPTRESRDLIKDWLDAQAHVDRCKGDLNKAECDLANSATALAKWMLPGDHKVTVRTRGQRHDNLRAA